MEHPQSNYDEDKEFFYGVPFTKFRDLNEQELLDIIRNKKNINLKILILLLINPLIIVAGILLGFIFEQSGKPSPFMDVVLALIFIAILLIGFPVVILKIRDSRSQYKIYNMTIELGQVRCFESDIIDPFLSDFLEKRCHKNGWSNPVIIEALPAHDILYSINGERCPMWIPIKISNAALKNPDSPYYDLPKSWVYDENISNIKRRRLTRGEVDEIMFYSKRNKRRIWYLLLVCYCSFASHHLFSLIGFNKNMSRWAAIEVAVFILLYGLFRIFKKSRLLIKDANIGWVLLYTPQNGINNIVQNEIKILPFETLVYSNIVWAIDGKPAGWRHKNKLFFGI